jgi:hypothetical protein
VRNVHPSFRSAACAAALFLGAAISLPAAPPTVSNLDVRGLQIGKVCTLTFTGTDLLPNPRLLTTARIARQTLKEGAKPNRITLEVELAPGAQPGFENWWLVTDHGISARGILALDTLAQAPFAEKVESLPVAMHGVLAGSQTREVTFSGKAGQEITCEVEAQRFESKVRPVLELYGPGNVLLKFSMPMAALRGDTRLEAKLPADGQYRLQFHDLEYAAAAPGHFCLKIGQWSFADLAFPPVIQRGVTTEVQMVGRVGETSTVRVSSTEEAAAIPAPWADPASASGPQVAVRLSDSPELVQERSGSAPQALGALPVAVNGRIGKPNEEDAYELTVEPESEVLVEVSAEAFGSPIDAELELRDLKGARLALNDDGADGPDPRLTYKVPKNVTKLIAVVRDVNGNGGPRCIYRLRAVAKAKEKPAGFALTMMEDSLTVAPGGPNIFKIEVARSGYDGPIDLVFDHLPDGVKVAGQAVPAQATAMLLTFSSDKDLPAVITGLKGRGKDGEMPARFDSAQLAGFQPWLVSDLALAGAANSEIAFSADWGPAVDSMKIPLGGKLTVPVKCTRPIGHDGPVRLTLITSQARRFTKGVLDANLNMRAERAVVIDQDYTAQAAFKAIAPAEAALAVAQKAAAANKDEAAAEALAKKVETAQAAVDNAKKTAAEAALKAKNEVEFPMFVPADLPEIPHQIAFKAELLSAAGGAVEAVAYTPVHEFPVVNPLAVKLNEQAPIKLEPKTGATVELAGKVERLEGAVGEVTLTLTGLPPGVAAPAPATVKSGAVDFQFELKFSPNFKPGEYPGLKISATGRPFGPLLVRSETAVTLKVLPPDPAPEAAPPAKP